MNIRCWDAIYDVLSLGIAATPDAINGVPTEVVHIVEIYM